MFFCFYLHWPYCMNCMLCPTQMFPMWPAHSEYSLCSAAEMRAILQLCVYFSCVTSQDPDYAWMAYGRMLLIYIKEHFKWTVCRGGVFMWFYVLPLPMGESQWSFFFLFWMVMCCGAMRQSCSAQRKWAFSLESLDGVTTKIKGVWWVWKEEDHLEGLTVAEWRDLSQRNKQYQG